MRPVYTQEELALIAKLRELAADVLEDKFDESDEFLFTWIKYGRYDLKKAEAALRASKKWRIENNMSTILLEEMPDLEEALPIELCGFDNFGSPIVALQCDQDLRKLTNSAADRERLIRYFIKYFENTMTVVRSQHQSKEGNVSRLCAILDLENLIFRQFTSHKVISACSEIAKIAESNYPGVIKTMYVLNAPGFFKFILNIFKPFLSAETIASIRLFNSDKTEWRKALLDNIAPDQLPSFLKTENNNK